MKRAIQDRVRVGPGGRIIIERSDLPEGAQAEVVAIVEDEADESQPSLSLTELRGRGRGRYGSEQDIDRYVREERDSWQQ